MAQKVDTGKRMTAAAIDGFCCYVLAGCCWALIGWFPLAGGVLPYLVFALAFSMRDCLPISDWAGASPGKRLVGIRALTLELRPCSWEQSAQRNFPLYLPALCGAALALLPGIGTWFQSWLVPLLSVLMVGLEVNRMLGDPQGSRIGDLLAGTTVVDDRIIS